MELIDNMHVITVKVESKETFVELSILGDGSLDHFMDVFKSSLISAGFSQDIANKLDDVG